MKVISVIEEGDVIREILKHLGLWEVKPRPPPKATGPKNTAEYSIDYSTSQPPTPAAIALAQARRAGPTNGYVWTPHIQRPSPPDFSNWEASSGEMYNLIFM
jgi:hypothetical protein